MSIETKIIGDKGADSTLSEAHVHPFETAGGHKHHGLVVLSHRFISTEPSTKFFTNENFGVAMNQDVSFTGTPELIFDGQSTSADSGTTDGTSAGNLVDAGQNFESTVSVGMGVHNSTDDTYAHVDTVTDNENLAISADIMVSGEVYAVGNFWIPTANAGIWDFSDSAKVTITTANNLDSATFDDGTTIDMSGFTAITGKVDLDIYSPISNSIDIQFGLAGVDVGNGVDLNDYIDTGDFTEQGFVIPKADLGIDTSTVDEMTITIIRSGGAKPTIKFDELQVEQTGEPKIFSLNLDPGERFHISELVFAYKDNITSISSVAGAGENVTNFALDPDMILGLSALTNGFVIRRTKKGKTLFSATIKTLGAHISAGALPDPPLVAPDGSSTFVVLKAIFPDPLVLTGDPDDTLTIQINDNMSALEQFTVAGRGAIEIK